MIRVLTNEYEALSYYRSQNCSVGQDNTSINDEFSIVFEMVRVYLHDDFRLYSYHLPPLFIKREMFHLFCILFDSCLDARTFVSFFTEKGIP